MRHAEKDADGAARLAYTEADVGAVVRGQNAKHFEEKVGIQERWKSRNHLRQLNTDGMPEWQRRVVERCYKPMMEEKAAKAMREGWWNDYSQPITLSEAKEALSRMKAGKAAGDSEVTTDILRLIDDCNLKQVVAVMEGWRKDGRIPDVLNVALIRLLPKTDKGTTDVSKCRCCECATCRVEMEEWG